MLKKVLSSILAVSAIGLISGNAFAENGYGYYNYSNGVANQPQGNYYNSYNDPNYGSYQSLNNQAQSYIYGMPLGYVATSVLGNTLGGAAAGILNPTPTVNQYDEYYHLQQNIQQNMQNYGTPYYQFNSSSSGNSSNKGYQKGATTLK